MTNLLYANGKFVTVHNKCSKNQPSTSVHFPLVCEDRVLFVWVDLHMSSCWQQHPYCERAIRLAYPPFFCKLRSSSNPTIKYLTELVCRFKQFCHGDHSELDSCSYEPFFSQRPILSLPKVLISSPKSSHQQMMTHDYGFHLKKNSKHIIIFILGVKENTLTSSHR